MNHSSKLLVYDHSGKNGTAGGVGRVRGRCAARLTAMLTALAGLALPAAAQVPARLPEEDKGLLQWVVMLGILVLLAAAAFMNPKRTHQD